RLTRSAAARLVVSERTVEAHVRHVLLKLGTPQGADDHRRVLAVLSHLSAARARSRAHGGGNCSSPMRASPPTGIAQIASNGSAPALASRNSTSRGTASVSPAATSCTSPARAT